MRLVLRYSGKRLRGNSCPKPRASWTQVCCLFNMDNKFTARPKPVADIGEKQPGSKLSDTSMAVSSVEYNHKMDGQSNSGKMALGVNDESASASTQSGNNVSQTQGKGVVVSQSSVDSTPSHSESRPKRKATESVNAHTSTSTPVPAQIIHVNTQKPKKGSFQITRVINRKQLELDAVDHAEDGDSIGDDFDETNTEDLSSEIMDTSKTTDIDQDPSSEDTVQSLAVEDLQRESKSLRTSLPQSKEGGSDSKSSTTILPVAGQESDLSQQQDGKEDGNDANFGPNRFRIVKVSNERFIRGRWTCHDYLDSERAIREKSNEDLGSGNSSAASSVHYVPGVDDPTKNPLSTGVYSENAASAPGMPPDAQPGHSMPQSQITNGDYSAQSMTGLGAVLAQANSEQQGAHEMPSSIVQSASAISNPISSQHSQQPTGTYTAPSVGSSSGGSGGSTQASQLPSQDYNPNATSHQDYLNQQNTAQLPQQPSTQTIPQQSSQQPAVPAASQDFSNGAHSNTAPADSSIGDISNTSIQPQSSSTNLNDFTQNASNTAQVGSSGAQSSNASPSDNVQTSDFRPPDGQYISPADDQQSTVSAEDDRVPEVGLMKPRMVQAAGLTQPLLEMAMQYPQALNRDPEDESGASTVAIDNKIEQAMDLVKSHLMFAVREEVLVLKEQIKELLEKNTQLEYENSVLRNNASPETLSKLSQTTSQGQSQSSQSS